MAMAAGTKGHRKFTNLDAVLVLLKQILRKWSGWIPFRPLSPSGCMPLVTLCPLWLYIGSPPPVRPEDECGGTVDSTLGSAVYPSSDWRAMMPMFLGETE